MGGGWWVVGWVGGWVGGRQLTVIINVIIIITIIIIITGVPMHWSSKATRKHSFSAKVDFPWCCFCVGCGVGHTQNCGFSQSQFGWQFGWQFGHSDGNSWAIQGNSGPISAIRDFSNAKNLGNSAIRSPDSLPFKILKRQSKIERGSRNRLIQLRQLIHFERMHRCTPADAAQQIF